MNKSFLFALGIIVFLFSFNVYSEQVYRNSDFQFRIVYPDNWNSVLPKGKNIKLLIEAPNNTNGCNVFARANPQEFQDKTQQEFDEMMEEVIDKTFWLDTLKVKYSNPYILDYGKTSLDNMPAFYVKANISYSALGITIRSTLFEVQLMRRNFQYALGCMSLVEDYPKYEPSYIMIMSSFVLEDY